MLLLSVAFAAPTIRTEGALTYENIPATPESMKTRLAQFQNVRRASLVGFDATSERLLIRTRFGETTQLHRVDHPLGARTQLTYGNEPLRAAVPSPTNPEHVLLTEDVGGTEAFQVVLLDLATGTKTQLSRGIGRCESPTWSPDGSEIAWTQTAEGATRRIMHTTLAQPDVQTVLFEGEGWWGVDEWFDDGRQMVLFHYIAAYESELHHLTRSKDQVVVTELLPSRKPATYKATAVTPDGKTLFVSTDRGAEFAQLWKYTLGKKKGLLLTGDVQADVDSIKVSPDGKNLLYTINDNGRSTLFLKTVDTFADVPTPTLPTGIVTGADFSPDSSSVALTLNRADRPGDVSQFEIGSTELTAWTASEVGGLDTRTFISPSFFDVQSFDGLTVPGFWYKPPGDGPHPVVISIHGGPEGQSRPWFSSTYQYWANELGIAIVVPNVRGSVGYGRTYHQLDNGFKRKDSVKDIGAILDWIEANPDLDSDRVVVNGGSYGGYMVLASLIDHGDRLAGGMDSVGISDFATFLKNTKDYRRDLRRVEYGDERDPKMAAFFNEISPLRNASKIVDPLFVIQGTNDPRVPVTEARQIVDAVRSNDRDVWALYAADEGHGFRKKRNRIAQSEAMALFLKKVFGLDE